MKTSDCHPVLLPDILHDTAASDGPLSNSVDEGKPGTATDVVLEYFTPATRSTTESDVHTSGAEPEGFHRTQPYRRHGLRVVKEPLAFLSPVLQNADGGYADPASLKRHRVGSPSTQHRLQLPDLQQSDGQSHSYMASAPSPATLMTRPAGLTEGASRRQRGLTEAAPQVHLKPHAHDGQSAKPNKREDAALPVLPTQPAAGVSSEPGAEPLRSCQYGTNAAWSAKAPAAGRYIFRAYGKHDTFLSHTALQQLLRKTQPVRKGHMPVGVPASWAEAPAGSAPAWEPISWYERGIPPRTLPRAVVVTRGKEARMHPAPAGTQTKKPLGGANGGTNPDTEVGRGSPPQPDEWSREISSATRSILSNVTVTPRRDKNSRCFPIEGGLAETPPKCGDSVFSFLPFCIRGYDASAFFGHIQVEKKPERAASSPTDAVEPTTQPQGSGPTGATSIIDPPSAPDVRHASDGHSATTPGHLLTSLEGYISHAEDASRPHHAPAAVAAVLSPSQRAPIVSYEDVKQTHHSDIPQPSCGKDITSDCITSEKPPDGSCEVASTRMTGCAAAPAAVGEPARFQQESSVSAHPLKANLWASFFWKSTPQVRLSSSSAGSDSCSTQCSSPRLTTGAPISCAAAVSTSKASASSAASPLSSPRNGLANPPATSHAPAFLPRRVVPSLVNGAVERKQQQQARQRPLWPFYCYYSHTTSQRQALCSSTHMRQQHNDEAPMTKPQDDSQVSSCCASHLEPALRLPTEVLARQAFSTPSWLSMYEATRLQVIGVPRGGGATLLLKSAEILFCRTATGAPCAAFGARVKEDKTSRQLVFLLPSREVVPINHLKLHSCISQGSFGTVFRARWEGRVVAVKQAHGSMTLEAMRSIVREINSFRILDHPYIIKYLGVCLEPKFLGIITEYLPGKCIFDVLWETKALLTTTARLKLCKQLAEAVNYMHTEKRLVHRDLKTSNLILDGDDGLKLCDFGKTRPLAFHGRLRLEDNGGSPRYMAPECFVVGNYVDEKVDVWGLGCCIMEIMGGPIPFEDIPSNEGVIKAVTHKHMSPTVPHWFHPVIKSILHGCFAFSPAQRPSAKQILDILRTLSPADVERYDVAARRSACVLKRTMLPGHPNAA